MHRIKILVMQIDTESLFDTPFLQTGRSYHFSEIYWIMTLEACEKISDKERWIKIKIKRKPIVIY